MNSTEMMLKSKIEINEVIERFDGIPFGNSEFQNLNLVVGAQITPERAYRAIGLRLMNRLQALKEAHYSIRKEDIDIEELKEKIQSENTSKFDKLRFEIEIEQKLDNRNYSMKLAKDAIIESNTLYTELQKYPKYTQEQFEAGERNHFLVSLNRKAIGIEGAREALLNMTNDYEMLPTLIANPNMLTEIINNEMNTKSLVNSNEPLPI